MSLAKSNPPAVAMTEEKFIKYLKETVMKLEVKLTLEYK